MTMKKRKKTQNAKSAGAVLEADPVAWSKGLKWKSTGDIGLPERLIDEVIGQDEAVRVAKKAARQRRNLLLIGDPGTGKSMIAKAMAQVLPEERQDELLAFPNRANPNEPVIESVEGGTSQGIVTEHRRRARKIVWTMRILTWIVAIGLGAASIYLLVWQRNPMVFFVGLLVLLLFVMLANQNKIKETSFIPVILKSHAQEPEPVPYVDATGAHAGALLGDVRHDPYQSGGLETSPHERVELGAIHRANKGILFIDEINVLRLESQQALLTAMQEGKYSIHGQSDNSSGAMVKTQPVPCRFILVAAGNLDAVRPTEAFKTGMHPALRSRIRGYGYEVFVKDSMPDNDENRRAIARFVAQEVRRDGTIPHFGMDAVAEILREAQRRAGRTGLLTLRLRELGGLVRTAGDLASSDGKAVVSARHVIEARRMSRSLEQQITEREAFHESTKEAMAPTGAAMGIARGLAFVGTGEVGEPAGVAAAVEASATPAAHLHRSGYHLSGHDGTGAKALLDNIAAFIKRRRGTQAESMDLHLQVLAHDDLEPQQVGAAAAVAAVSAIESLSIRQDIAIAGALSVTGRIRPVPGITQMVESAVDLGYSAVVVPESCRPELQLDADHLGKIRIVFARDLSDVLKETVSAKPRQRLSKPAPARVQTVVTTVA